MKYLLLTIALLTQLSMGFGQVSGIVTNENGAALPYANIYLSGTNIGTSSNLDGSYVINVPRGQHDIIYQYVGYESVTRAVNLNSDEQIDINVMLTPQSVGLDAVTIAADAEDPAYGIMRQVIAKRSYYKGLIPAFDAGVYIKGMIKMENAPEKIMGQDVGDMGGLIDSSRQGIIYLSETQSHVDYTEPDQIVEEIYASKTSGINSGVDFNNLRFAWFNFYKERLEFEREIISPLADDAFRYYRFRLEGSYYDEDGNAIDKIAVLPKDSYRPAVFGHLYIVDSKWNIHSVDLSITGKSMKLAFIDTITIKQSHVPVPGHPGDARYLINQSIDFTSALLGFEVRGGFTYVFTEYTVTDPSATTRTREVLKVLPNAEKDNSYWQQKRPIPLTTEEVAGYRKRDSIKAVVTSKPYMDSIDHEGNKLKIKDFLLGYTHSNSYRNWSLSNTGLINKLSFNAVEGIKVGNQTSFEYNNDETGKITRIRGNAYYGLSDQQLKLYGSIYHRFDRRNSGWINLAGGRRYRQVDGQNPIPPISNTLRSLLYKEHLSKVYEDRYISLRASREVTNGVFLLGGVYFSQRRSLDNTTDYSLGNKEDTYEANNIGVAPVDEISRYHARIVWYPGIRYMTYPTSKVWLTSNWPRVQLGYTSTFAMSSENGNPSFSRLELNIRDSNVTLGTFGQVRYNITAGTHLRADRLNRMDRRHFLTNNLTINWDERYFRQYKNMPYYTYDTDGDYLSLLTEYDMNGLIMDKVPLLRDLGARTVIGLAHLSTSDATYSEASIGLDGFQLLGVNILRFDYVWSWNDTGFYDQAFVVTIRNPIF